ncbi:translation initiation factor eIF-2B subunit delta [Calycina marina]|uniref:Translation initiation factor eIF2B subunit delta n=1 Tax=Calycina marina TaxID=1763456 RepID=A0A9P7Z6V4_9HELO|nr:translation initiation factor eIF-2B subunit delta [Calycina marina]
MSETTQPPAVEAIEKPAPTLAQATDIPQLSGSELKKKNKAEKAARRAKEIAEKQGVVLAPVYLPVATPALAQKTNQSKPEQQKKPGASSTDSRSLTIRAAQKLHIPTIPDIPREEDKTVEFFRHLNRPKKTGIQDAGKEVHQAVLGVGLQIANYTICGSCARLVATLQAFKEVIASYKTPPGNTLTRHLTSHVLSPNIEYLASCRPLSISMGNAIRWLKLEISKVDIDVPDTESKKRLCSMIDEYIYSRVIAANEIIANAAAEKINDGDVILTYAKSSVIQAALVIAHKAGKKFRVIVIDSRPLKEGMNLASSLQAIGIRVRYCLLNGLVHSISDATKVFLGAHAMMSNGRLFSRVGTAIVAMEANQAAKPVLVLCETVKFTERVALDSIVLNEVAPPDELVLAGGALERWRQVKALQLLNLMYDVTPAEYVDIVITEYGSVPPTSVPTLYRTMNETE